MYEREEHIESKSSEIAFTCILGVYGLLILFSKLQRFITGESFIDYSTLVLAILVALTGKYFAKYCYTKERSFFYIFDYWSHWFDCLFKFSDC